MWTWPLCPPEQLSALASSVSDYIDISNVRNWEVILANIKCELYLGVEIFLESEETEALVRAMESRVEHVGIQKGARVDIRVLTQYNGQGECEEVRCSFYKEYNRTEFAWTVEELNSWAQRINWTERWTEEEEDGFELIIKRKSNDDVMK